MPADTRYISDENALSQPDCTISAQQHQLNHNEPHPPRRRIIPVRRIYRRLFMSMFHQRNRQVRLKPRQPPPLSLVNQSSPLTVSQNRTVQLPFNEFFKVKFLVHIFPPWVLWGRVGMGAFAKSLYYRPSGHATSLSRLVFPMPAIHRPRHPHQISHDRL